MNRSGFGGSLIGNVLTLIGFFVGYLLIPGKNIWIGIVCALLGYIASYYIRKKRLRKNERILTLAKQIAERLNEGADAAQFTTEGIRIQANGSWQNISMAAFGAISLKDPMEAKALADVTCEQLSGTFYYAKGAYPPELRRGTPETT